MNTAAQTKPVIKVANLPNFEFWLGIFKPRTKKWQREALKRLKAKVGELETLEENQDKIKALKFLLQ